MTVCHENQNMVTQRGEWEGGGEFRKTTDSKNIKNIKSKYQLPLPKKLRKNFEESHKRTESLIWSDIQDDFTRIDRFENQKI